VERPTPFHTAFFLGCLFALSAPGWGGVFSISGQTNSPDNTNPSARAMALGSAFVGIADDSSALFGNPAGLAWLKRGEVSTNTNFWLVDTFQETALVGLPLSPFGGIGFAASYLDFGSIEGRDASGSLTANYTANQLYLAGGGGWEVLKGLAVGAGLQGYESALAGSSYWDLAFNLGALYRPFPGFRVGAACDGLGVNPTSGLTGAAAHWGASYEAIRSAPDHLLFAASMTMEPGTLDYLQTGLEYGFKGILFLRGGWEIPLGDNDTGGLTGLTAGVGIAFSDFKLDYAYLPYGDLGSAHRVSLGYAFGSPPGQRTLSPGKPPLPAAGNSLGGTAAGKIPLPPLPPLEGAPLLPAAGGMLPALPTGTAVTASTGAQGSVTPSPEGNTGPGWKNPLDVEFDFSSDAVAQGQQLEKEGKYQAAAQLYEQEIQQNPRDVSAWRALGIVYYRFHQKDYAVRCFEQVLKLQPDDPKLFDWLEKYKASGP
jgi:tetratricopeptide (TPR) repeat protein